MMTFLIVLACSTMIALGFSYLITPRKNSQENQEANQPKQVKKEVPPVRTQLETNFVEFILYNPTAHFISANEYGQADVLINDIVKSLSVDNNYSIDISLWEGKLIVRDRYSNRRDCIGISSEELKLIKTKFTNIGLIIDKKSLEANLSLPDNASSKKPNLHLVN